MSTVEHKLLGDGSLHVTIAGKIDENFDGSLAARTGGHGKVVIHLGGVRSISSLGVRALEAFIGSLAEREVVLLHVSPAVASQMIMIPNLVGHAHVENAKLPFACPSCGAEKPHSVPWRRNAAVEHAPACVCGATMELDGLPEQYLPS
jgi:anti-anti-sigma regulatory factor